MEGPCKTVANPFALESAAPVVAAQPAPPPTGVIDDSFVVTSAHVRNRMMRLAFAGMVLVAAGALVAGTRPTGDVAVARTQHDETQAQGGPKCQFGGEPANAALAGVPAQCASILQGVKDLGKCSTADDSDVWNELIQCAFGPNQWMQWRYGGEGGCGGPTLFKFCQDAFPGDADMIRCCSASRCPWSASPFGRGGGQPICIDDSYAVNICCLPCSCWLYADGGNSDMTIDEDYTDPHGASYAALIDKSGKAIAAPFPCGATGMFGRQDVLSVSEWQQAMGDCAFDPMGGRRQLTSLRPGWAEPAWVERQ